MEKHLLTRNGLLDAQVCSTGTWDEALEWLQTHNPAGTQLNWCKNTDVKYAPIKCAEHPDRTHYMFTC